MVDLLDHTMAANRTVQGHVPENRGSRAIVDAAASDSISLNDAVRHSFIFATKRVCEQIQVSRWNRLAYLGSRLSESSSHQAKYHGDIH
jgi:hypothetical protein